MGQSTEVNSRINFGRVVELNIVNSVSNRITRTRDRGTSYKVGKLITGRGIPSTVECPIATHADRLR